MAAKKETEKKTVKKAAEKAVEKVAKAVKAVPAKKAALVELNMKALKLGKEYKA